MLNKKISKTLTEEKFKGNTKLTLDIYNSLYDIAKTYTNKYDVWNRETDQYCSDFIEYKKTGYDSFLYFSPEHYRDRRNGNMTFENYFVKICAGEKYVFLFLCFYKHTPKYMKNYIDLTYTKYHTNTCDWYLLKYEIDNVQDLFTDFNQLLNDMYEEGCKEKYNNNFIFKRN